MTCHNRSINTYTSFRAKAISNLFVYRTFNLNSAQRKLKCPYKLVSNVSGNDER